MLGRIFSIPGGLFNWCLVAQLCPTLCNPMDCSTPALPVLHHLPELAQVHGHWVYDAIQPPLALLSLLLPPSIYPIVRAFSNELALCIRWPKYWSFSFSIRPSNEYSGLISFRTDWFHFLATQGTQEFSSTSLTASILQYSAFFMVQRAHLYMTTTSYIIL